MRKNPINVLRNAESVATDYNDTLAINIDIGSQFYASADEKRRKGISEFEQYLRYKTTHFIKNNPQGNGKIERWFREYTRHRARFSSAYEFMDWYNNRIHGELNLEYEETPNDYQKIKS